MFFGFFQEQREVIDCLVYGNKTKYPESVRKFSMNQQYYSTAAYKSLRLFFNKNLPTIRTLQMWYTSVDGSPGISESALSILRERAESYLAENGHKLHLAAVHDEMSIKKQLSYCNETQSFVGLSTVTNSAQHSPDEDASSLTLAKDALVIMVVGPDFKLPVAYELLNGLESADRAALTLRVIKAIEEVGAIVISLTGDGLPANITTAESLGAKFNEGKPYFMSPTHPEQKIYIILNPPHNLKLVRKYFASNQIYHEDQLVDWNLLKMIVERQSEDVFNLCNKLTKLHINWNQKPMNVRLAAETISNSVADTLILLRDDDYEEFEHSNATINFLRFFNDGFDILNFGDHRKEDGKYKRKLCAETADHIFEFAERFKRYIGELEYRSASLIQPILISSACTGFFGFNVDFTSLQGIYKDFVLNGPLKEFFPFQFSQDHLEQFFSLIR